MGNRGLGKTTLARLVYNHQRVKAHFEIQSKGYVSSDFQVQNLTRKLILAVNKASCGTLELEEMQGILQDMLEGKRFLIVLVDVWIEETTEWDKLCKPLIGEAKGSILVVTTRNHSSCRMLAHIPKFQQLRCLSEDDSWLFFKKLAFAPGRGSEDDNITELESIGKELVKRCNGIPLAVNALGSLMWSKNSVRAWQSVKDNEMWEEQKGNDILPALKLSYHTCLYI